jgi:hypothetical protein
MHCTHACSQSVSQSVSKSAADVCGSRRAVKVVLLMALAGRAGTYSLA